MSVAGFHGVNYVSAFKALSSRSEGFFYNKPPLLLFQPEYTQATAA